MSNNEIRNENARWNYHRFKAKGICVMCRKQEAFPNRIYCPDCNEKRAEYYEKHKEKRIKQIKERQARLKAEGKCISCGKDNANGYGCCDTCLEKHRIYSRRYRSLYCQPKCTKAELREIASRNGKRNIQICNAVNAERRAKYGTNRKKGIIDE